MNIFKFLAAACACLVLQSFAEPVVIAKLDMEDGKVPSTSRCYFSPYAGGKVVVSTDTAQNNMRSKGSLKGTYPIATGGIYIEAGCNISDLNIRDVYIEFYAKMPLPQKQGLKFLKIFGKRNAEGYANTTVGLDYTGIAEGKGSLYAVSFGDGSTPINDTQNVLFLGKNGVLGRSAPMAQVYSAKKIFAAKEWGDGWHHFRVHVKFNSGSTAQNEVPDGEYSVEINGVIYVEAKNLFNRHYSNLPIQKVSFFDWSQGGTVPFEIWYDDITISTGGFVVRDHPEYHQQ